jgi:hypothetical protein
MLGFEVDNSFGPLARELPVSRNHSLTWHKHNHLMKSIAKKKEKMENIQRMCQFINMCYLLSSINVYVSLVKEMRIALSCSQI